MASESSDKKDIWSADAYRTTVAPFVAALTSKVVGWLDPQPQDEILDVGCGEGVLTARLAPHVTRIVGVDGSPNMIESFNKTFPDIDARVVDCRYLDKDASLCQASFSKVFSNAALHWILRDEATRANAIKGCYDALKPGGLFVSESGGLGNVAEVHAAIIGSLVHRGIPVDVARNASPWWFPSLEAMKALVEGQGFRWIKGEIELRQTVLTDHQGGGIEGWVRLFGADFLALLPSDDEREAAVKEVVEILEGVGRRQHDGAFTVNYIRLRFVAQKD
ncbi:S-adenosyl-L-methionine-dependent methyltransferase [Annulohypoxylon maeteangense]|uniref:S-adenosyl-L-methionine-dependent methyltransferase n=1 Tax=Annulohypoxylon maeteangense TaxID=1927788 RepID=UPI0020075578|nr:S-adenosyl-L-methionine-dependent methyltransferase [Annulohypoxylon maeteangense]KAI0883674.1 S-adenosyl-L-methionine-dependent methyltransferase [Annulohypoxylon maeteangense]